MVLFKMRAFMVFILLFGLSRGITITSKKIIISDNESAFSSLLYFEDSNEILASNPTQVAFYTETGGGYKIENILYKGQEKYPISSIILVGKQSVLLSRVRENCLTWITWGTDTNVTNKVDIGKCDAEAAWKDGDFQTARFASPNKLTMSPTSPKKVLVADELNNKVREVDLASQIVQTMGLSQNITRPVGIHYDAFTNGSVLISTCLRFTDCDNGIIIETNANDFSKWKTICQDPRLGYINAIVALQSGIYAAADYTNNRVWIINSTDATANGVYALCNQTDQCDFTRPLSLMMKDSKTLLVGGEISIQQVTMDGLADPSIKENLCYLAKSSGVKTIHYKGKSFEVWCDMESSDGPWIVFLKRFDGTVDFDRVMADYEAGFGDKTKEHWLGLEYLHLLTSENNAELRIDVEQFEVDYYTPSSWKHYAKYKQFAVGDRDSQYKLLNIDGYEGDAGDMESGLASPLNFGGPHKRHAFSTKDRDLDSRGENCAADAQGGWWFNACYTACLTCGPYKDYPNYSSSVNQMIYYPVTSPNLLEYPVYNLKAGSMKLKLPPEYDLA